MNRSPSLASVFAACVLAFASAAVAAVSFDPPLSGRAPNPSFLTPIGPLIVDVNGDGEADLVTADYSGSTTYISLGNAAGTGAGTITFSEPNQPYAMASGDLNDDGKADLIFSVGGAIRYYATHPTTGFAAFAELPSPALFPASLGSGDFNGDGLADIVAAGDGPADLNGNSGFVEIYLTTADANGDFTGFSAPQVFPAGKSGGRVAVGDLNGDSFPDVAVANTVPNGNPAVRIFLGDPAGALAGTPVLLDVQSLSVADHPVGIAIGDLTGDGKGEIVLSSYSRDADAGTVTSWVEVLAANAEGQFSSAQGFLITPATASAGGVGSSVALADIDGDGKQDIATVNYLDADLHVLRITAQVAGGFSIDSRDTFPINDGAHLLALGDLNGDSKPDLVIAHADANGLTARLNTSTPGIVNSGKALYFAAAAYPVDEGSTVQVVVKRGSESTGPVSVSFTVGGTATPSGNSNSDFNLSFPSNLKLDFQPSEFEKTIFISLSFNAGAEPDETIVLTLQPPLGDAELGIPATTTVTIHDTESGGGGGPLLAANALVIKPGSIVTTKAPELKTLGVKAVARNSSPWLFSAAQTKNANAPGLALKVQATTTDPATNPQWTHITNLKRKSARGTAWLDTDFSLPVASKVWFRTVTTATGAEPANGHPVGPYKIIPGPLLQLTPTYFTTLDPSGATTHPGEDITYRFRYSNLGDGPATNVVLSVPVPGFTRYAVHTNGASSSVVVETGKRQGETTPVSVKWTFASIPPGADRFVDLVVTTYSASDFSKTNPNAAAGRVIKQHAYFLTAPDQGIKRLDGTPKVMNSTLRSPLELKVVSDSDSANPGQLITYTLTAKNLSGVSLPAGVVTNQIPFGTALDKLFLPDANGNSSNTPVPTPNLISNPSITAGGLITWNLGTIPPNSTRTLIYTARVIYDLPSFTVDKKGVSRSTEILNEEYDFTAGPNDARVVSFGKLLQPVVRSTVTGAEPASAPRLGLAKRAIGDAELNEPGRNGNGSTRFPGIGDVTNVLQNRAMDFELLYFNSGDEPAPRAVLHDVIPPGLILRGFFTRDGAPMDSAFPFTFYNAAGKPMIVTGANIDEVRSFDIRLGDLAPNSAGVIRYTVAATAKPGTVIHSLGGFDPKAGLSAKLQGFFITTPVRLTDVGGTPDDLIVRVMADVSFDINYSKGAFQAKAGDQIPFDISYTQNGDVPAGDTRITLNIPPGTTPILSGANAPSYLGDAPDPTASLNGSVLEFIFSTVPPHSDGTVRVFLQVNSPLHPALAANRAIVLDFPKITGSYFKSAATPLYGVQSAQEIIGEQTATATSHSLDPVPIVDPLTPRLMIGRIGAQSAVKGTRFTYSIFFANFGDQTATNVNIGMQIPFGTRFISATNGTLAVPNGAGTSSVQNATPFTTTPRSAKQAKAAGGVGPDIVTWHFGNQLVGRSGGNIELTVEVDPKSTAQLVEDHSAYISADNAPSKVPGNFTTQVRSGNFVIDAWEGFGSFLSGLGAGVSSQNRTQSDAIVRDLNSNSRLIMTGGTDTLPLTNGVLVISLGGQRAMVVGSQIISGGAGNIISNDGASIISGGAGNIVSAGAGNAISISNIAAGFGTRDAAFVINNSAQIVAGGAGNIIAAGAGNLIGQDGAGLIGIDGAGLGSVSATRTNLVSGGAGNIISGGGGNIFATGQPLIGQDGAGLIGTDGGSIISGGGGNIISGGAGNIISNDGASILANDGASIISGGAGN